MQYFKKISEAKVIYPWLQNNSHFIEHIAKYYYKRSRTGEQVLNIDAHKEPRS